MAELAIKGGNKIRNTPFPGQYSTILDHNSRMSLEEDLYELIKDNVFSRYRGNATYNFFGGKWVKATEELLSEKVKCNNTLLVNSCTSALFIACAAIGLQPGDEVIVTPWSMSCSATIPLFFGAVPVFADIEYDSFCLNPDDVARKITNKTKAIIVVDLFGNIADYERLRQLAIKYNLYIIEDAAQAIGAYKKEYYNNHGYTEKYAGTFGDIGCFSFTQGKHFTCGEGGAIVTNNEELYKKCALIRNHAEAVLNDTIFGNRTGDDRIDETLGLLDIGLVGGNFRMTELQAVVLHEMLSKWDEVMLIRKNNVNKLKDIQKIVPYIEVAHPRAGVEHSYYTMPFYFKLEDDKVDRNKFIQAVKAELSEEEGRIDRGIPISCGYIKPLYEMPIFYNDTYKHWAVRDRMYKTGDCSVCEHLQNNEFFLTLYHGLPLTNDDCSNIIEAFYKVYKNIDELRE
ncbi:MAG: DegT/DnrJ/EryC1/StrS family aminotransferase [Methanogenium sp.]|jgi:dTDP-4-amino-4,6-dideoxygalactose transaminase